MITQDCPKASLVEALRDGRLGPQECASMERHVPSCAACTELTRSLDRIGESLHAPRRTVTPLEHQRARVALLERAAQTSPVASLFPRAQRRPFVFAFAAAAVMMLVAVGWAGGRLTAPGLSTAGVTGVTGARTNGLETAIRPSNDATFDRKASAGVEVVTLTSGTLDVTVRSLAAGERFVVRTTDAEVEVRGTAFRVEAEGGRIRGVAVTEGTVEVRYAGFSAVIPSGGSWRATSDAPLPASPTPSAVPTASAASAASAANPPPSASAVTGVVAVAPAQPANPASRVAVRSASDRRASSRPAPLAAPVGMPELVAVPAPEPVAAPEPAPPVVAPASREFAAAMSALGRGDYAGSAAQLEAFAAAHPADARVDEADYLRAIALQRAGRTADAAAAARRYLATRPAGAHRVEARQIAGD